MTKDGSSHYKLKFKRHTPAIAGMRVAFGILCLSGVALVGSFGSSVAQLYGLELDADSIPPSPHHIKASVDSALRSNQVGGTKLFDRGAIDAFYAQREYQPYWMSDTGPLSKAHQFIETLEASWTHGLNPHNYHVLHLRDLVQGTSFIKKNELELLLSDAFIRYARDLSGIRVNASGLEIDGNSWQQRMSAAQALNFLASGGSIRSILKQIEPSGNTYETLRGELTRLVNEEEPEYAKVLPIRVGRALRSGQRDQAVPAIRMRLDVTHEADDPYLYDDRLTAAVIRFQREHALGDDGIIGSNTLEIMNRTNRARIEQIIANLERLRWVRSDRPDRFVVVNIPAATLWAVDDGRVDFEMPVIVGKPKRPTKSFITSIQGVRLNPDWTIPPTIKRDDVLPELRKDAGYLHRKGIQLLKGHGRNAISLDPSAIDWSNISSRELHGYRMVQGPGRTNPLGQVRVLMPNAYNIYLHDTNHPEYFDKPSRALSSGCIRMKEPKKMASFILEDEPDWHSSDLKLILSSNKKTDIGVTSRMPVYILYYTAWTDSDGRVVYGSDIYNQDSKLIRKLSNIDGFYIPRHNEFSVASSGRSGRFGRFTLNQ